MTDGKNQEKNDLVLREEKVLKFWNENNIFNKSLEKEAPHGDYVFYDGPPFATGTPHYGHLLGSAIKDAVPRYWTMRGYKVERQWGWDCHGLPIENIVEKELGTKNKKDIEKLGVKKFNDLCRERIFTYINIWNEFIPRFGRWADMDNPYRTMDKSYMESEWWVFKQLYEKELVYEDYRSMHICPRCETTLSQSEVADGYQNIKDIAVTVAFPLKDEEGTMILAWTTTPWTLPGNVALAVGTDITYVTILFEGKKYIVAKERVEHIFSSGEYSVLAEMKGVDLVGKEYTPPFDAYVHDTNLKYKENAWKVYAADFVDTESGTGVVHIAPAFGEDDMTLAQEKQLPFVQHVGMDGVIRAEVKELAGLSVKPIEDHQSTDVEIIKYLAQNGILFSKEKYEHSYPHCWRCDTPLINYATSSWFVAVEKIKPQLLTYAENINWSPAHIKKGRWGKWLEGARDWSISRQRFWANTIPVWKCDSCSHEDVFGSITELREASGVEVDDLHKDIVDEVEYECACGGRMHRVPDVLDTWFNSGSVPFASLHYPFENKERFEKRLPADFIGEGIDQTRAWFYYQHVLAGGVFNQEAFKNVIVNGMVMAEDGKKMAKKLKNYPDPQLMVDTYGADAIRLYLLSSPVVRAEDFSFSERDAAQVSSKVMGRISNVYSFYELYKDSLAHEPKSGSTHVLDQWIVTRMHQLHAEVTRAMDAYELDRATRPLFDFVDDLSTWYIRRSRDRLKDNDEADKKAALETIRWVLRKYAKVSAPFTPFIADWLWLQVKREDDPESVHLVHWCTVREVNDSLLADMHKTRDIVSQALEVRARENVKVRQVLQSLRMKSSLPADFLPLIADEVNVKEVLVDTSLSEEIELDLTLTDELREEGIMRDIIREIQGARKQEKFELSDTGTVAISGPVSVTTVVEKFREEIEKQTGTKVEIADEQEQLSIHINKD